MRARISSRASVPLGLLGVLLLAHPARAEGTAGGSWPIEVGAMADSIGFAPGIPHPLLSVGTEIPWDNEGVFRLVQTLQLDYRLQPQFIHGPGVNTRLIARFMANVGFFGEVGLGVGYFMGFFGPDTLALDAATGAYGPGPNAPRSIFKASLGLGLGMDFSVRWNVPLRVSAGYDETLLFNFAPEAGFPIVPAPAYGLRLAWFFGGAR